MEEKKQNIIGGIILIVLIVLLISYWLIINNDNNGNENNEIILTPLEVTADPTSYMGSEIKVKGIVITNDPEETTFLMMPTDIYIQCGRNAFCGEEYAHLTVNFDPHLLDKTLPSLEHEIIVTGNIERRVDDTYNLVATAIEDNGEI
jgi:hypothetical protein